jgi:hypothetical protein
LIIHLYHLNEKSGISKNIGFGHNQSFPSGHSEERWSSSAP